MHFKTFLWIHQTVKKVHGGGKKKNREVMRIKNENSDLRHHQEIQTLMYQETQSVFNGLNIILFTGKGSKNKNII